MNMGLTRRQATGRRPARRLATAAAATAVVLVSGCTIGDSGSHGAESAPPSPAEGVEQDGEGAAQPKFSVSGGETDVPVRDAVSVSVDTGKLVSVTMTNDEGVEVSGTMAPDKESWKPSEDLGYYRTYTMKAVTSDDEGKKLSSTESFTTVQPALQTMSYSTPVDGSTVGVGQSIIINFDEPIPDREKAQEAISVATDPPVEGAFYWFSDAQVRWRPEKFWTPGTKVKVSMDIYGKDLGNGTYGQEDSSTSFTIGKSVISYVDNTTKTITTKVNGKTVKTMPTSLGKEEHETPNGVYVIADRHESIIMDSSTYGVPVDSTEGYRTPVKWATRMSYSGIFVHAAPWSVWAQGNTNTSHGCLNVSTADGEWFYENSSPGDLVIVKNTNGGQLDPFDGLGDWNIDWKTWKKGNADDSPSSSGSS